jgi:DNA-binding beta-propeller fold protein YncE
VMKLSREGKLLMTLGTLDQSGESPKNFHQPSAVAVAPTGEIYVTDGYGNSRVVKFSPEGKYLKAWGKKGSEPGEFDTPHGIAIDAKGNVYVAERLTNRVQVFDSEGRFLTQWLNYPRADSIFINKESQAYVGTGKGDTRIFRLDLSGRLLGTIGTEKTFGYPHGIFVDPDGSLYIADPIANSASQPPRRFVRK